MILPIADRADTNVARDKYVRLVHAKLAPVRPIVAINTFNLYPMIPPIADNADTSVAWDKPVNGVFVLPKQAPPIVTASSQIHLIHSLTADNAESLVQ